MNERATLIQTFVIVSVWLALLALPFPLVALVPLIPTVLPHNKLLDCFEPSIMSSLFRWVGRCNNIRTIQNVVNIMVVNTIPNNIGDNWYDPLSAAIFFYCVQWKEKEKSKSGFLFWLLFLSAGKIQKKITCRRYSHALNWLRSPTIKFFNGTFELRPFWLTA